MDEPYCCGEPMVISEYDADDDLYVYYCAVDHEHKRWIECDDETWK